MSFWKNEKGILAVVSGFSGAGKGTIMKKLLEQHPEYALSVSVTTRAPREGEEEGVHYFFRTKEQFESLIREDALIEFAQYQDNYYGTPRSYVEEQLKQGRDVILEIEMIGAEKVKARFPEAVLVFVTPPSFSELKERLLGRGTETEEQIAGRLKRAAEESFCMNQYDYILINPNGMADECTEHLHHILQSEHSRTNRNLPFVEQIRQEAGKGE